MAGLVLGGHHLQHLFALHQVELTDVAARFVEAHLLGQPAVSLMTLQAARAPERVERSVCGIFGSAKLGIGQSAQRNGAITLPTQTIGPGRRVAAHVGIARRALPKKLVAQVVPVRVEHVAIDELGWEAAVRAQGTHETMLFTSRWSWQEMQVFAVFAKRSSIR